MRLYADSVNGSRGYIQMKFNYAIFDLDGTLFDSTALWRDVDEKFLNKRGLLTPDDYFSAIKTMKLYDAAAYTIERFGLSENPHEVMEEWRNLAKDSNSFEVKLKPYAKEYVLKLFEQGVKMGVATAAEESYFLPVLKNNGIYELFDSYTTLHEVSRGKGFPDIYLKAASKLSCKPEECAVFEDILPGIMSAKSAGFFTIGIFEDHTDEEKKQMASISDLYINTFFDLLG